MLRRSGGGDGGEPVCRGLVREIQQECQRDLDGGNGAGSSTGAAAAGSQADRYVAQSVPDRYPAERALVIEIITALARQNIPFDFWLYGVAEKSGISDLLWAAEKAHVPVKTHPFLAYPQFIESLSQVAVGLQPIAMESPFSRGKSFGKVLAYLAADVAVVASDALDHPLFFRNGENGMLANTAEDWVENTARLLQDMELRQRLTDRAWEDFGKELSTKAAARKLATVLGEIRR